jgi:hypothetical protein
MPVVVDKFASMTLRGTPSDGGDVSNCGTVLGFKDNKPRQHTTLAGGQIHRIYAPTGSTGF